VSRRRHYPLNAIRPGQQDWAEVVNSPLSEAATLGFEYGFSLGSQVQSPLSLRGFNSSFKFRDAVNPNEVGSEL
jgi:2-oxoglutarate dehydrogenase complex dehydrogenase (E1) component-like enzyme